jgi:Skp family chaperone for outer membrane proteins
MRALAAACCLAWAALCVPPAVNAQNYPVYEDMLPVAMINQDRLFTGSDFGQKFEREYASRRDELVAENRSIEAELENEELDLLDKRSGLESTEFRRLASAFDKKVIEIRQEQKTKITLLNKAVDESRREFFKIATPVIERFMDENGILFLLHEQAIFLGRTAGDITDDLIIRINAEFSKND